MFKKFRIKHEGFHRLAIIVGLISMPIFIYLFDYSGFGHGHSYRDNFISYYFAGWKYISVYPGYKNIIFVYPILHFISYLGGYFLVKLIIWIKEGFTK